MNMKSDQQKNDFDIVLDLTQQMLTFAETSEWNQLFDVEKQRGRKIKQMSFLMKDRSLIERVLEIDESIREIAEAERSSILGELKTLNKGKSAINAYAP